MPKRPPEPLNPYQYLCRHELASVAWGIVTELRESRPRTHDERRDLSQRVLWLLCAFRWLSHNMDTVEAGLTRGRFLADNFMEHYTAEEKRLRHSVLKQAEEVVLLPAERPRWSLNTRIEGKSLAQLVQSGPDGLRIALTVLEQVWIERSNPDAQPPG